jgi:hypothetical protein
MPEIKDGLTQLSEPGALFSAGGRPGFWITILLVLYHILDIGVFLPSFIAAALGLTVLTACHFSQAAKSRDPT